MEYCLVDLFIDLHSWYVLEWVYPFKIIPITNTIVVATFAAIVAAIMIGIMIGGRTQSWWPSLSRQPCLPTLPRTLRTRPCSSYWSCRFPRWGWSGRWACRVSCSRAWTQSRGQGCRSWWCLGSIPRCGSWSQWSWSWFPHSSICPKAAGSLDYSWATVERCDVVLLYLLLEQELTDEDSALRGFGYCLVVDRFS